MKDQLELLQTTDWDVLIILDACRADYFLEAVSDRSELSDRSEGPITVRSPFIHTPGWVHRVGPLLESIENLVYFTANPVVDREVKRRGFDINLASLWKNHWGYFTRENIPSVHPMSVTAAVIESLDWSMRAEVSSRLVVHYMQPHCPYIGDPPLRMGRLGQAAHDFGNACHKLPRPDKAVEHGEITWSDVHTAYRGNLELVLDAVRNLTGYFADKRVVITADHGDVLGEDGLYGHEGDFGMRDELRNVPWLVLEPTLSDPSDGSDRSDESDTISKLEALGYV